MTKFRKITNLSPLRRRLMQHLLGLGLGTLGQVNAHVPGLMHPAALLARVWKDLLQCRPESHSPVAGGQFGRVPSARFECQKYFAPALRALPDAVLDGQKMLFTKDVDPDDDQNNEPVIAAAQPAVDTSAQT